MCVVAIVVYVLYVGVGRYRAKKSRGKECARLVHSYGRFEFKCLGRCLWTCVGVCLPDGVCKSSVGVILLVNKRLWL